MENLSVVSAPSVPAAPYSIDVSKGTMSGQVSSQWASRPADQKFEDLDALHAFKLASYENAWEQRTQTNAFELWAPEPKTLADTNVLKIGVANVRQAGADIRRDVLVDPTHWSFGQLCQLGGAPASYLRRKPTQLVADALTHDLRYSRTVEEIKLYGSPSTLMAATGPDYGRIPDHQVVTAVQQIAGNGLGENGFHWKTPGQINWSTMHYDPEAMGDVGQRTFYGSDRDMFLFLVDDRRPIVVGKTRHGTDDHMFRGFVIQNSEVGSRSLKILAFYLRGVCMNRCLWGCEGFDEIRINHTRLAPERWIQRALPALESFANGSERNLQDSVLKAKQAEVASNDDAALSFLQNRGFSRKAALSIFETHVAEEDRPIRSAWDMAQGVTAYARTQTNTDDRLKIELEAKKVLDRVTGPGATISLDDE